MIDKVKFREMFAYYDKEVVAEVIDDFISEYEAKLNQIRDSIEDRNFELIRQSSHSFKGVVGHLHGSGCRTGSPANSRALQK